jgi:hypothetical protein
MVGTIGRNGKKLTESLFLSLSLSLSSKMKSYAVLNKASGRSKQEADQVLS